MTDLNQVVSVSVTIQDAAPTTQNFGVIAIIAGDGPGAAGSWQGTYDASASGLAAMVSAGFLQSGAAYVKASAISAQQPKTAQFKVYKRAVKNTDTKTVKVTKTTPGFVQSIDVAAGSGAFVTCSYTNGASETTTTIATALELLIEAATGVASTSATDTITVTSDGTAGDRVYFRNAVRELTIKDTSADAGIATDLGAALLADPEFFGFVIDGNGSAEIQAAAAWAEANSRVFLALSADTDIGTSSTTDVESLLKASTLNFTAVLPTRNVRGANDAALMGRQFALDPGTSTYALKRLSGPTADNWNSTELGFIRAKSALSFVNVKGQNITLDGAAASGRHLDLTIGIEWLKARIGEAVFGDMINQEKINYTSKGIDQIDADVRGVLQIAQNAGIIAPGWTTSTPKASAITLADKKTRLLRNMLFNCVATGAIQSVQVAGTVSI